MSEERRCAGTVSHGWRSAPCSRHGKYAEDGKDWCGVHLPSNVRARREKQNAKQDAEFNAWREKRNREAALAAATEALVKAALAWDEAIRAKLATYDASGRLEAGRAFWDAVAAYRKAKGEGA